MGADWYYPFVLYGAKITLNDSTIHDFICKLKEAVPETDCINYYGCLDGVHNRMESVYDFENEDLAEVYVGFIPTTDINQMIELINKLNEHITLLQGKGYGVENAMYYALFDWYIEEN